MVRRSKLGFAPSLIKYLVLTINALSLFIGLLMIIIGGYIANADSKITGITSNYLPIGLVCLGVFITTISFVGCIGAQKEMGGLLKLYFALLAILVFFQIAVGAIAFVKQSEAQVTLDERWTAAVSGDPGLIKDVENFFSCCGYTDVTDRAVPSTCAADRHITTSCKAALTATFVEHLKTIGIAGLVMGIIEMTGLVFSCILFNKIRKLAVADRDAALLAEAKRLEREGNLQV